MSEQQKQIIEQESEDIIEQQYVIDSDNVGKRIDVYLLERLDCTRSKIKNMIEKGDILLNNSTIKKAGVELKLNDQIVVLEVENQVLDLTPQDIPLDIVYQDDDLAVINKQKGLVVHPAVSNYNNTLVNGLLYHLDNLSAINGVVRPGIVHRLDKDTTGLLVVAKNDKAHLSLSKQIAEKSAKRIYVALVEGVVKLDDGVITSYIERSHKNRLKMAVSDKGKWAQTHYKVLKRYDYLSLVEYELKTGRTHQIRVHSQSIFHPILGDQLYGAKREKYFKFGQFLHAYKLTFVHPTTGEQMTFEAPMPKYMVDVIKSVDK